MKTIASQLQDVANRAERGKWTPPQNFGAQIKLVFLHYIEESGVKSLRELKKRLVTDEFKGA
jgi:hypothetical protein